MLDTFFFETPFYIGAKETMPFTHRKYLCMGWDGVVSVATLCRLDGIGIESPWEQDFLHLSRPVLGPTQLPVQWVLGVLPGCKAARAWH